ncbi:saccharopine dehydrogenase NADP-binding domain-containing protein [Agrococcus sp. SCSIO52902]|uniref:saccharopine dehydrogenase family protein n=1 Tax=Agrococcus sp. SCSIO52902 TaxID=2933290 RepID=UPI001FF48EAF|nr:saccharopine dehydrogenase NADP-binding domain-containing protein [Agrococcus sp. SCSIO52902]UOW00394.1 saccharopine dehydrogenase NADP-binding domain-containing protein [Agrococcus sp. SCSIO52902]
MPDDRDLDLVLLGASGFVGRLVAGHLAEHAPAGLRIALAGRSRERLEAVRSSLGAAAADWPMLIVDSGDAAGVRALAERTRVVATTVGPYLRHGLPLAEACAAAGTDCVDLTGEVLYVRALIDRCRDRARTTGARLVVSCGFDSVPSDLAVHLLRERAAADGAGGLGDTTLRVRRLVGGVSGGTIASLREQLERTRADASLGRVVRDPAALSGGAPLAAGQPDVAVPFRDAETGEWDAPFAMAPYNTRLVRRSHALREAHDDARFRYREVVPTGRGTAGRLRASALAAGFAALAGALATPGIRSLVARALPAPGEGPSAERRAAGSFEVETTTTTTRGRRYAAAVAAEGDPGYAATAVMLGEAALALAVDSARCSPDGGVLTPAVALGDVLVERLRRRGFRLDVRELQPAAGRRP